MDCSTIEADDNVEDTARMSCEIQCNSLLRNQQDALPTVSHQNSTFISCHPCDCNLDAQFGFDGMCFHWLAAITIVACLRFLTHPLLHNPPSQ